MPFCNQAIAWLVLLVPLAAAVGITLFTLRRRGVSAGLSIGAVILSFMGSLVLLVGGADGVTAFRWISVEGGATPFLAEIGLRLDALSRLMLLVVTGVAGAIHIYSWGYMNEDRAQPRYFAGLSLFMFSMLGIVLANNFLMLFIFWELVGVSSYLLIGFWHERAAPADAAKKAFLTNRLGDFGFLLGIVLVWSVMGTLDFAVMEARLKAEPGVLGVVGGVAGLLVFCGAVGKSAQFPLHVWLPDAMEGPTPVSALIHAATMVAAGVYMLCRVFFILSVPGSFALPVVAWVGGVTALLAALIAVQQSDIKRILAYSTLSQLGYMVMAVGLSSSAHPPAPAMFHLTTHAFFKALLFLGAGSVICALHHEQDIWKMGALARRMPVTFWTFLAGTLALCGVPPFSGFFSKDAILARAYSEGHMGLFVLGVGVAALTTFYMFRLVLVVFVGPAKSQAPDRARESSAVMTVPLVVLAVPSVLAGMWGIESWFERHYAPGAAPVSAGWSEQILAPFLHAPVAAVSGLLAVGVGLVAAWGLYRRAAVDPLPGMLGVLARWMRDRFYFDEAYVVLIRCTQDVLATVADWVDRWLVAGLVVRGTHGAVELAGRLLRLSQTGSVQVHALLLAAGVVLLLGLMLLR